MSYLTLKEAAQRLAVSEKYMRKLLSQHLVRGGKLGRLVRIEEDSLAEVVKELPPPTDQRRDHARGNARGKGGRLSYRYISNGQIPEVNP